MRRSIIAASTALALVLVSSAAAFAQADRPSHIHAGLCPAPGDVVAPLSNTQSPSGEAAGPESAIPVEAGFTVVELALSDILAADHSIVVHASADDMATYVVCGDIGGQAVDSGMGTALVIGLAPVGDSTFGGVALLLDMGDGTTGVDVFINDAAGMMMSDG